MPAGDGLLDRDRDEAGHLERPAVELDPDPPCRRFEVVGTGVAVGERHQQQQLVAVEGHPRDALPEPLAALVDPHLGVLHVEQLVLVVGEVADPARLPHDDLPVDLEVGSPELAEGTYLRHVEIVQTTFSIGPPRFGHKRCGNVSVAPLAKGRCEIRI